MIFFLNNVSNAAECGAMECIFCSPTGMEYTYLGPSPHLWVIIYWDQWNRKKKHGILLGYDLEMSLSTTLSTSKCHYMNIIKWIDIIFSVIAYIQ